MDREHQTQDCRYRHQERLRKFFEFQQGDQRQKSHNRCGEIDDRPLTQHDHRNGDRADRGRCDSIDKGLYPCKLSVLREIRRRDNGKGVTRKKRGERRHDRTRET